VSLIGAYVFFVVANIVSGNCWQYVPRPPGILKRAIEQGKWYAFGIFRDEPHPHIPSQAVNFNVLQALTYWNVMYLLMPLIVLSGLVYLYPEMAPDMVLGFDGLLVVAVIHYLTAAAIVLFLMSHIYLCTTGKTVWSMFKMMITGWHQH
jgi:thiosulfate reductase cytochrome b subunit